VFLTNNFVLSAEVIAALYKKRWSVELFFKWIKQNLCIKHFYGTSENAVKTQIWITPRSPARFPSKPILSPSITRLMREHLISGDVTARKAYLSAIINAVVVSEQTIRIMGSNDNNQSTFKPEGKHNGS
jgi:hypothetical protein